ncbi:hypothetical protein [Gordonia rubripertincta]|uniref:hypothetical protein n=1 Tax=Gordonia rubripertincta TaxID=36822 RepID=UPI000B8D2D8D|nr:hypothetical protein [Gordonia rubripertincta]ASR04340.1 hypothetical protein GCWB2_17805 [Gordonia rubripertincta]
MSSLLVLAADQPPQYPVPPFDLSASSGLSWTFTILCLVISVVATGYGAWLVRRGEALGLIMLLGGLLTAPFETLADYVGLLWFASDNAAVTIELMGRHIPLYVVLGYAFFFGLLSYIDYRAIALGMPQKYFLFSITTAFIFDWALQSTGATFGLYEYYGVDPFRVLGAPIWWFVTDAVSTVLIAFVLYSLRHRMVGWGRLLPLITVPMVYAGWNGAACFPIFIAKNSNFDEAVNGNGSAALVLLGGLLTIAMALITAWLLLGEVRRSQDRNGVTIRSEFNLRDLLFAPLPSDAAIPLRRTRPSGPANSLQNR